ncbi:hypothetical protein Q3Z03_000963 [Salmonella enterica]|nr:hypothetical protein [Salmonella enterica]
MGKKVLIATIEFESSEADKPGKIGALVNKAVENLLDRLSYEFFHRCSTPMEELEEDGVHITVVHGVRRDAGELPLPEPEYKMPLPGGESEIFKGRFCSPSWRPTLGILERMARKRMAHKATSEHQPERTNESDMSGKLIKDNPGVYDAHLGESATKPYAIARVVNINIRNDVIGDGCFTRTVADTLIKYGEMIKSDNAGHHLPEFFDDDNGNRVTITGGRLSEEERLPSPAPRF